jgi:hypothetical protein
VGVRDRKPVVAEARRTLGRQLGHLRQLGPRLALGDRRQEADRDDRLRRRSILQRAQHRSPVHHRIRVRHREDRAEPAGRRGPRAGLQILLVLTPRRAQMHVRVDKAR